MIPEDRPTGDAVFAPGTLFGEGLPKVPGLAQECGRQAPLLAEAQALSRTVGCETWLMVLAAWACFASRVCGDHPGTLEVWADGATTPDRLALPDPEASVRGTCRALQQSLGAGKQASAHPSPQHAMAWSFCRDHSEGRGVGTVHLQADDGSLAVSCDALGSDAVLALRASFLEFFAQALGRPDTQARVLGVVSAAQKGWLAGVECGPQPEIGACVLDSIWEQARQTPEAIAVTSGAGELTYAVLMARANGYCAAFQRMGVVEGDRVAILLPRGHELLAALLGVMLAGAAFVPVSIEQPAAFCNGILRDAEPRLIVCETSFAHGAFQQPVLLAESVGDEARGDSPMPVGWDDLAYIMYTSGSTGTPKGVMVTQRGFANYVRFAADLYFREPGGAAMATSIGFDLSITSLFAPLLAGQAVHMIEDGLGWLALLERRQHYSVIKATPSHIALARQAGVFELLCRSAATFVLGGEALPSELADQMRAAAPGVRIFNEYGPTETVVGSTVHLASANDPDDGIDVDIGLPVPHTECRVLDGMRRPVPPGWPGELYIGGVGVSPGYWRQEALSAERFTLLPDKGQCRYYQTGDLVRWGRGGRLVYLGRNDSQVKINGVRVEIGSVRASLMSCPGVLEAAVVPSGGRANDRKLHAYVVASPEASLQADSLLHQMRSRVPVWMVPASVQILERLPLTPNGKLDLRALEPPSEPIQAIGRQNTLSAVRQVWMTVLNRSDIADDIRILDAGGTSFEVVRIVAGLNSALALELKPADMFRHPTISQISDFIDAKAPAPGSDPPQDYLPAARAALRSRLGKDLRERKRPQK